MWQSTFSEDYMKLVFDQFTECREITIWYAQGALPENHLTQF